MIASFDINNDTSVDIIVSGGKEPSLQVYLLKESSEDVIGIFCWVTTGRYIGESDVLESKEFIAEKVIEQLTNGDKLDLSEYSMEESLC